ncbi:nuclear transport factor 2 family protein [Candidatus Micrarchaeota archaeon]|nr:nuclear transport factor 2 family protein [Candidatus Micrarchaeota archaeon]
MNTAQVKKIMEKYGKAWENQDSQLILECFTKNGVYQESPLARPYRGHKAIKKFWDTEIGKNTKNIRFSLKKCFVSKDEKTGFCEWECKNQYKKEKHHMVGIAILTLKGSKISYLNEYWNTRIQG